MTSPKTVLITGASSGIGKEFAEVFAAEGFNLVLVARSSPALHELADRLHRRFGVTARAIVKDLTHPRAPEEIYRELHEVPLPVDILVNNAGAGTFGHYEETDLATELGIIQLNVTALTHLTKLFVRDMVKRGSGKILNVASTAAFQPGPLMAVYYATKAYVLSFSQALSEEFRARSGVTVTVLCPGLTASNFQERAGIKKIRLFFLGMMDARTVARIGYKGLMKNKTVVIPGLRNRLLVAGARFSPRGLVTRVVKWFQEKR